MEKLYSNISREPSPTAANAGDDNKLTKTINAAQIVAVAALPLTIDTTNLFSFSLSADFKSVVGKLNILNLFTEEEDSVFIFKIILNPKTDNTFTARIKLAKKKSLLKDI